MKAWVKTFWKHYFIDWNIYNARCGDCNLLTCDGCKLGETPEAVRTKTVELIGSCISLVIFMIIITLLFGAIGG